MELEEIFKLSKNKLLRGKTDSARELLREIKDYEELDPKVENFKAEFKAYETVSKDELSKMYATETHEKLIRQNNIEIDDIFSNLPLPLRKNFGVYHSLLPVHARVEYIELLRDAGLWKGYKPTELVKNLKEITKVYKKLNYFKSPNWFYFVDMDTMTGWNTSSKVEENINRLKEWFEKKPDKGGRFITKDDYRDRFVVQLTKVMEEQILKNRDKFGQYIWLNIDDWLENEDNWTTKGSSAGIKAEMELLDGKTEKSAPVKGAISITKSVKDLKKDMFNSDILEDYRPAVKIELGFKNRLIIASGNINYLRLSYVSSWLEKMLSGWEMCTLFLSSGEKIEHYKKRLIQIRTKKGIAMPLDAAGFDNYVSKFEEVDACFEVILKLINKYAPNTIKQELTIMTELARKDFMRGRIKIPNSDEYIEVEDGMPSGIRWTALLDSLINIGRYLLIIDYVQKQIQERDVESSKVMAQGDDDDILLNDWYTCWAVFRTYEAFNIPCHATKNFISDVITEFLRKYVDTKNDGVFGYPARKITGFNFKNPESRPSQKGEERLNEKLSLINVLVSRRIENKMMDNFMYLSEGKVTSSEIKMWVSTPRSLSGGGVNPSPGLGIAIKNTASVLNEIVILQNSKSIVVKRIAKTNKRFKVNVTKSVIELKSAGLIPKHKRIYRNINVERAVIKSYESKIEFSSRKYIDFQIVEELRGTYWKEALNQMIEERRFDEIENMMTETSKQKWLSLKKMSRKIQIGWLKDDFQISIPTVLTASPEYVSYLCKDYVNSFKQEVTSKDREWDAIRNLAVTYEMEMYQVVKNTETFFKFSF